MTDFANRWNQITTRCNEIFRNAERMYGIDLSKVSISPNLRGRVAGLAGCMRDRFTRQCSDFSLKFNRDMIAGDSFEHILNECVPHEIAHLVCYARPDLGSNHDTGWKRVCRALGGNGERCHTEAVVMARGNTYEYVSTTGARVRLSDKHHARVQAGAVLRIHRKVGGGQVDRNSAYSLIAVGGKMIDAQPRPANYTPVPAQPVVEPKAPKAGVSRTVRVREWIRKMVAEGHSQAYCIAMCGVVFDMPKSQGRSYVLTQWDNALAGK